MGVVRICLMQEIFKQRSRPGGLLHLLKEHTTLDPNKVDDGKGKVSVNSEYIHHHQHIRAKFGTLDK